MKLYIISGVSGSGKSTALHVFEDLEYYCIDNLPVVLLPAFAEQCATNRRANAFPQNAAIGIDARNIREDIQRFPETLDELKKSGISCELIFFNADDSILIKRFSETRRKHPLSEDGVTLAEAIKNERTLLDPIANCADLIVDTSHYNIYQLRDLVKSRVTDKSPETLSVLFQSFGFKHGVPGDADFVFDVRCLPNPYWEANLRKLTGQDEDVVAFLEKQPLVSKLIKDIAHFLEDWIPQYEAGNRSYITIAIGCTGGQHRSVYIVEQLAQYFTNTKKNITTRHRELL